MCIVVAYGVYQECCEGKIEKQWAIDEKKQMDFFTFREKLGKQMLTYAPVLQHLPGDECMRSVTSVPRASRIGQKRKSGDNKVTSSQFRKAKRYRTTRLCGDLEKLCHHVASIEKLTKPKICAWCGLNCYTKCTTCLDSKKKPVTLHYNAKKGSGKGSLCFYNYHNDLFFGLGRNDSTMLLNGVKGDWNKPDVVDIRENSEHIRTLKK